MSVTITISDDDYRDLARVLSKILTNPKTIVIDALPLEAYPQPPVNPTSPALPPQQNPMVRDRWARDRKGGELPNPEGCETRTVHLWKAEIVKRKDTNKTSFMKLAWDSPNGTGSVDASCFDVNLFPFFLAALKQSSVTLYTVRNGNYLNVVGVRA